MDPIRPQPTTGIERMEEKTSGHPGMVFLKEEMTCI